MVRYYIYIGEHASHRKKSALFCFLLLKTYQNDIARLITIELFQTQHCIRDSALKAQLCGSAKAHRTPAPPPPMLFKLKFIVVLRNNFCMAHQNIRKIC